jgi:hypothetical protein
MKEQVIRRRQKAYEYEREMLMRRHQNLMYMNQLQSDTSFYSH